MSNDIASLGLRIDTSDVAKAEAALDNLAATGEKTEVAAKGVGEAWSGAGKKIGSAASSIGSATTATAGLSGAESKLAESTAQALDRLTKMAKASLDASSYHKSLASSVSASASAMDQLKASSTNFAAFQAAANARGKAFNDADDRAAKSAKAVSIAVTEQGESLQKLLGQIDPVVAALARLDAQEAELRKHKGSGLLDTETFTEYKGKIDAARNSLTNVDETIRRTGNTSRQTSAALRQLPSQFSDIFVSLQSGQSPFSVFLQQGAQIKDSFGGAGPALRETGKFVLGLVNPYTLAAAAVAALALAYKQGSDEATAFQTTLILTGNAAGTSAGQLASQARSVSKYVGTVGAAAEVLAQLAASGKIPADQFDNIAIAALKMQEATGKAASETVKDFEKLAKDPVKYSKELNEQLNYLTGAQYAQIEALQRQGDARGAANLAESIYSDAMASRADRIKENLGYVESAWKSVKDVAKSAWDAFLDVGRDEDPEERLERLKKKLKEIQETGGRGRGGRAQFQLGMGAGGDEEAAQKAVTDELVQQEESRKRSAALSNAANDNKAGIAAQEALNAALDSTASRQEKLKKRYAEIDDQVKKAAASGASYSTAQIEQLRKAAEQQFKEPAVKTAKAAKTAVFRDDAATRMLQSLREQESSLSAQLGVTEKLTDAEKKRAEFERLISDLKNKDILTADQKSLLASESAIKAQLDKNVAISEEVKLHNDSLKLQERSAQIQESIKSSADSRLEQQQRQLEAFGKGGKSRERTQANASVYKEFQRYQDQLNKATPASQLGSEAFVIDSQKIKDGLNEALAANQDYYSQLDAMQRNWKNGAVEAFEDFSDHARNIAGQTYDLISETMESITKGVSDSVARSIIQGDNLRESMADLAQTVKTQVLSSLIEIGTRYGINAALEMAGITAVTTAKVAAATTVAVAESAAITTTAAVAATATAATTTTQVAAAATTATAWTPAAIVSSIGSFGAAAAIGLAAVVAALAFTGGFRKGGYTGNGGVGDVAGVVHGQEYVFDAAATARIGVQNLEAMRKGTISAGAPAVNYAISSAAANDSSSSGSSSTVTVGGRGAVVNQTINVSGLPDNRTANQIAAASSRKQRQASRLK